MHIHTSLQNGGNQTTHLSAEPLHMHMHIYLYTHILHTGWQQSKRLATMENTQLFFRNSFTTDPCICIRAYTGTHILYTHSGNDGRSWQQWRINNSFSGTILVLTLAYAYARVLIYTHIRRAFILIHARLEHIHTHSPLHMHTHIHAYTRVLE